jgi:hypothetical protein
VAAVNPELRIFILQAFGDSDFKILSEIWGGLKIQDARMTQNRFHDEDPEILRADVQNLVSLDLCTPVLWFQRLNRFLCIWNTAGLRV